MHNSNIGAVKYECTRMVLTVMKSKARLVNNFHFPKHNFYTGFVFLPLVGLTRVNKDKMVDKVVDMEEAYHLPKKSSTLQV